MMMIKMQVMMMSLKTILTIAVPKGTKGMSDPRKLLVGSSSLHQK